MEILEPKLGDVVSGDLWCLVNKLCEAATSSYYAPSDAARREISSSLPKTTRWQLFKIGDRLPTVTFSLPSGTL